jgi:hypothetical protein
MEAVFSFLLIEFHQKVVNRFPCPIYIRVRGSRLPKSKNRKEPILRQGNDFGGQAEGRESYLSLLGYLGLLGSLG